jgi:hypothetical protein
MIQCGRDRLEPMKNMKRADSSEAGLLPSLERSQELPWKPPFDLSLDERDAGNDIGVGAIAIGLAGIFQRGHEFEDVFICHPRNLCCELINSQLARQYQSVLLLLLMGATGFAGTCSADGFGGTGSPQDLNR